MLAKQKGTKLAMFHEDRVINTWVLLIGGLWTLYWVAVVIVSIATGT
jgi:hypothetical protein